jgi:hypothetical protein
MFAVGKCYRKCVSAEVLVVLGVEVEVLSFRNDCGLLKVFEDSTL